MRSGILLAMLLGAPGWVAAQSAPPEPARVAGAGAAAQGTKVQLRVPSVMTPGVGSQGDAAALAAYRSQQLTVEIDDVDGRPSGGRLGALLPPTVHALTYVGTPRVRIDLEDFLTIVERKDLVRLQKHWRSNRYAVVGAGSAAAGIGIILIALSRTAVVGATNCTERDPVGNCIESNLLARPAVAATQWSGVGLTVAGLVMSISAAVLPRRLVSVEKLNDLASGYNRRLRERLGLPPEFSYRKPSFTIAPRFASKGAGLDAVLVF
ncbi:MAG TPA: hypothetical protein VH877_01220 [Polyangia bacterium]|nr:hypothetical protein [Polyangia bacterium]